MKSKLKYILPALVIFVLAWGLLEVAEKAALLLSIFVLTSYLLYLFRQDRKIRQRGGPGYIPPAGMLIEGEDSPLLQIAPLEKSFLEETQEAFTAVLRQSLKLKNGRFKQDVEEINRHANLALEALEAERIGPQDCAPLPGYLEDLSKKLQQYFSVQDRVKNDPSAQHELDEIQQKIRKIGAKLKKWTV